MCGHPSIRTPANIGLDFSEKHVVIFHVYYHEFFMLSDTSNPCKKHLFFLTEQRILCEVEACFITCCLDKILGGKWHAVFKGKQVSL